MDIQKARALSDLELLEIEVDLLWESEGGPELVLACARDACARGQATVFARKLH
jgi:hypothetical protein